MPEFLINEWRNVPDEYFYAFVQGVIDQACNYANYQLRRDYFYLHKTQWLQRIQADPVKRGLRRGQ